MNVLFFINIDFTIYACGHVFKKQTNKQNNLCLIFLVCLICSEDDFDNDDDASSLMSFLSEAMEAIKDGLWSALDMILSEKTQQDLLGSDANERKDRREKRRQRKRDRKNKSRREPNIDTPFTQGFLFLKKIILF